MKPSVETERRESSRRRLLLALLLSALYALHQDFWFWHAATPLVLGFLPIGLFYHVAYTVAASLLMALLVKWAWPAHLEAEAVEGDEMPSAGER